MSSSYSSYKASACSYRKPRLNNRPIVHSIFFEALEYTDDGFWRRILEDMSKDRFPAGFIYKDNFLSYRKKNVVQNKIEISKQPHDVLEQVILFLKDHGNIMSDKDYAYENAESMIVTYVDKKSKFDLGLVYKYTEEYADKYNLTESEENSLRRSIILGITIGVLNPYIHMDNGEITHVYGIERYKGYYHIDPSIISGCDGENADIKKESYTEPRFSSKKLKDYSLCVRNPAKSRHDPYLILDEDILNSIV